MGVGTVGRGEASRSSSASPMGSIQNTSFQGGQGKGPRALCWLASSSSQTRVPLSPGPISPLTSATKALFGCVHGLELSAFLSESGSHLSQHSPPLLTSTGIARLRITCSTGLSPGSPPPQKLCQRPADSAQRLALSSALFTEDLFKHGDAADGAHMPEQ